MKLLRHIHRKLGAKDSAPHIVTALLCLGSTASLEAQDSPKPADKKDPPPANGTASGSGDAAAKPAEQPGAPNAGEAPKPPGGDEIELSFQGVNIDMVVQWLAQTTGKSVVKHPRVQCQLTIVNSKKLPPREALDLVYRALGLEGFTVVETAKSILIVPEGQEPKINPQLVDAGQTNIPEGRQRLVKFFPLKHLQPEELVGKVRGLLSDKGTIEADSGAHRVIVTDYTDNVKMLADLINELDVTDADASVEVYVLKYAEAEEVATLIGAILNSQPGASGSAPKSSSHSSNPPPGPMDNGPQSSSNSSPPPPAVATGAGSVHLWPDKMGNRLIVSAPRMRLADVQRLIEVLDTQKPQDVAIRTIPLKNVNAEDLAKEIAPLYEKMSGRSLKEMIEVTADSRSSALIVLSSEANFQTVQKLISTLDTEDAQEKVVKTFPLKNADAQDVAKQLQDLYKDQDSVTSRYFYYYSTPSRSNARKLSVVADRRRNTLIVQAPPGSMEGIGKMIDDLDEPAGGDALAPKIFPLKYVSASDIEDVLNELFLKKQQQRTYWDYYNDMPAEPQADRDVGRLYGKVRITSEPYSNTIIVTSNSKESLAAVEEVLKQLDVPSQAGETTLRVGLRFAKAATVANSINILFAKNGSPPLRPVNQPGQQGAPNQQPQQNQQTSAAQNNFEMGQEAKEDGYFPWLGGQPDNPRTADGRATARPVSDLVGRVRVVSDQRSNALLISANVHFFPQVLKLIEDLDAPTAQVLIEARIVEVSSDFLDKLGVRWSPDGSKVFTADDYDNSLLAHSGGQYQKGFGGMTTVNAPSSGSVASSLATSLRSGVLNTSLSMDFLVQFLKKNTDATVLAEPQINIADNELGQLFVGQQVPFIDKSQTTDVGALNQSFQYKPVGVILEVTPHINASGDVALKIRAESSAIEPGQTLFGGAILDTRDFKTDLTAKSGETLVLGGIIQKQVSDTIRKTPILGDIPGLGWAFKKKDKTSHEVELLVFLRPKVMRSPEEAKLLLEEVEKKAPLIRKSQQELDSPPDPKKKN